MPDYGAGLDDWMSQAPQQPSPTYLGKPLGQNLTPYVTEPQQQQAAQDAAEAAAARVKAPYAKANARTSGLPQLMQHYGEDLGSILTAPKRALTGEMQVNDPETNMPTKAAMGEGASLAGILVGGGMPMAERGALGMAGGKLKDATGGLSDMIKAYHGSPHDFDRFDLSKIGTGEGAQAYGHGLYFAENEGVAKEYRERLSKTKSQLLFDGKPYDVEDPSHVAANLVRVIGRDRAIKSLGDVTKPRGSIGPDPEVTREWLTSQKPLPVVTESNPGSMYHVAIKANPDHFLDWDKPLSEQHPEAQKKIESAYRKYFPGESKNALETLMPADIKDMLEDPRGSQLLRDAGVPGIKYADQGSRRLMEGKVVKDMGDGKWGVYRDEKQTTPIAAFPSEQEARQAMNSTRNFVVFDDKLIDILKKYGIAGIGALPAMNAYHYQSKDGS